jgi:hypothetical protein
MKRFIGIPSLLVVAGWVALLPALKAGVDSNSQGADAVPPEVQKALELPKGDEKTKALSAAAGEWAKKDPTAALAWSQKLPRDIPFSVSAGVVAACALADGKASADWAVQHSRPPEFGPLHGLLFVWSSRGDPAAAAAWCAEAPKTARYISFFSVGDGWYLKDQPAASQWVATLESADDRHAAIHGLALKWGRANIPAATVWIKQLKGDDLKVAVKAIAGDWRANKFNNGSNARNEAAMKEWLDSFPLSDADKTEDLTGPPLSNTGTSAPKK